MSQLFLEFTKERIEQKEKIEGKDKFNIQKEKKEQKDHKYKLQLSEEKDRKVNDLITLFLSIQDYVNSQSLPLFENMKSSDMIKLLDSDLLT